MDAPPPLPTETEIAAREAQLRELTALDTSDLLALCLRVRGSRERLRLYLALLRQRGGARAQLASCLVCFDLAQKGDQLAVREFTALAPTVVQLFEDQGLVVSLLANDPYLQTTWESCRDALQNADPRETTHLLEENVHEVGELDLLSDDDFDGLELPDEFDFDLDIVEETPEEKRAAERQRQARQEYALVVSRYIGQVPEHGAFSGKGFVTAQERDIEKLERFLLDCARYGVLVPEAQGMASLGQLYLATHLRLRTLFGRLNPRRQQAIQAGFGQWPPSAEAMGAAASLFQLEGAHATLGLEKVLELLMDFVVFCNRNKLDPLIPSTVDRYIELERQPPQVLLTTDRQRRRG